MEIRQPDCSQLIDRRKHDDVSTEARGSCTSLVYAYLYCLKRTTDHLFLPFCKIWTSQVLVSMSCHGVVDRETVIFCWWNGLNIYVLAYRCMSEIAWFVSWLQLTVFNYACDTEWCSFGVLLLCGLQFNSMAMPSLLELRCQSNSNRLSKTNFKFLDFS
jgi:hypothetical protein